jgi:hypothetical protein
MGDRDQMLILVGFIILALTMLDAFGRYEDFQDDEDEPWRG